VQELAEERRSGIDRRSLSLAAYAHGALHPRRRSGRRRSDLYPVIDWHSPRVLAVVSAVLGLCVLDGVLTVLLMQHGAAELNPFMALFVPHNLLGFAAAKLTLTGLGMCVLVACSRMRLFRAVPGEALLYIVLACYIVLVCYELQMFMEIPDRGM